MSRRDVCKGCEANEVGRVRQCRIYSSTKQYKLRFKLCEACWAGMWDLMVAGCDGWQEGLWNPVAFDSGVDREEYPRGSNRRVVEAHRRAAGEGGK